MNMTELFDSVMWSMSTATSRKPKKVYDSLESLFEKDIRPALWVSF